MMKITRLTLYRALISFAGLDYKLSAGRSYAKPEFGVV